MRSLVVALLAVLTTSGLAAASCSYPNFRYDSGDGDDESGGAGGQGGDGTGGPAQGSGGFGGMGAATSSSMSSSTAGPGGGGTGGTPNPGTVTCGETPNPVVTCNPGQVCCYHKQTPSMDTCGAKNACGADFYEFQCETDSDCVGAQVCCWEDNLDLSNDNIMCKSVCTGSDKPMCAVQGDCTSGTCSDLVLDYNDYKACQ